MEENDIMNLEARVKWSERTDRKKDPLDFFRENYDSNITRGQLAAEDPGLYERLKRKMDCWIEFLYNEEISEKIHWNSTIKIIQARQGGN